jgi:hypothetical protein
MFKDPISRHKLLELLVQPCERQEPMCISAGKSDAEQDAISKLLLRITRCSVSCVCVCVVVLPRGAHQVVVSNPATYISTVLISPISPIPLSTLFAFFGSGASTA